MLKKSHLFLLFCLGLVMSGCLLKREAPARTGPSVTLLPTEPAQGGRVTLFYPADLSLKKVTLSFQGQLIPFYRFQGGWQAQLGVRVDTLPGRNRAKLYYRLLDGSGGVERFNIPIAKRRFPFQRIRLSKRMSTFYDQPFARRERKLIGRALRTESETLYSSPPWLLPCRGRISTRFGMRRIVNGQERGVHRGVDIACGNKVKVKAPGAGVVLLAEPSFRLHGRTVVLNHGQGLVSLYLHLSRILVKVGEEVKGGQVIGEVGATGVATGPHLHWGVYVHTIPVDPLRLIQK